MNRDPMSKSSQRQMSRYPGGSWDPGSRSTDWIPAFAGMTEFPTPTARKTTLLAPNESQP